MKFDDVGHPKFHPGVVKVLLGAEPTHRHYKGDEYVFIGIGRESTNGETDGRAVAVYWSKTKKQICVRDLDQFEEPVTTPRFEPIKPSDPIQF